MIISTIISSNYIAKAKCMLSSLQKFYPKLKLDILLTNATEQEVEEYQKQDDYVCENFIIHTIGELKIEDVEKYRQKYDLVEWNTFVKPKYLQFLLKKDSKIIYTDADTYYYDNLDEIDQLLDDYNVVLTPHRLFDEEENLNSLKLLQYGYYNLGFLAISNHPETIRFLEWWHWKLTEYGYLNLEKHMAWDQKWCDLVPIYFDKIYILKHPGYNIAFWNIFERYINKDSKGYLINNEYALKFIHFSHYLIEYPMYMRAVPSENSFTEFPNDSEALQEIFQTYRKQLIEAGHEKYRHY